MAPRSGRVKARKPRAIFALVPDDPRFRRVPNCDLCRAARITPWHHEDDICWIAECDICDVPMVVWRFHGVRPPEEHLAHMKARLADVAATRAALSQLGVKVRPD